MTFIVTRDGTPRGDFATKREAQMYVNRNNAAAARRGDDSKPYALFEGEVSTTYVWVRQGNGETYLVRTQEWLRNVGPGQQEVVASRRSEAKSIDPDYAEAVAWANEVEAEDAIASHVDRW
jgi:hypothetical protein